MWLPAEFGKSECSQTLPFVFDFSIVGASNRSVVTVVAFAINKPGAGIEKSDVYINKSQRE